MTFLHDDFPGDPHDTPDQRTAELMEDSENARFLLTADILMAGADLLSRLKNERNPTSLDHTYSFLPENLPGLYLPPTVLHRVASLDIPLLQIDITLGTSEDGSQYLTLNFIDAEGMLHISRSDDPASKCLNDQFIEAKPSLPDTRQLRDIFAQAAMDMTLRDATVQETGSSIQLRTPESDGVLNVSAASKSDINRFITSVLAPNKTGDYSFSDNHSLFGMDFSELIARLDVVAPHRTSSYSYGLSLPESSVTFVVENGETTSTNARQVLPNGRCVGVEMRLGATTAIEIYETNDIGIVPIIPTRDDLLLIKSLLGDELARLDIPEVLPIELLNDPDESNRYTSEGQTMVTPSTRETDPEKIFFTEEN